MLQLNKCWQVNPHDLLEQDDDKVEEESSTSRTLKSNCCAEKEEDYYADTISINVFNAVMQECEEIDKELHKIKDSAKSDSIQKNSISLNK